MYEKILIVDDEAEMLSFLKDALEDEGYTVLTALNGESAIKQARQAELILLDIMMPHLDGYQVCQKIRDLVCCPIIFLSAKVAEEDKLRGLALGGDDYLVKPFGIKELKARIQAHLRREIRVVNQGQRVGLHFGELWIDLVERVVYFKQQVISLTRREFEIVELLALHPGQVFTREQIYEKIWGYEVEGNSSNIPEHIRNLRKKLAVCEPEVEYLSTVWGMGYRWERMK